MAMKIFTYWSVARKAALSFFLLLLSGSLIPSKAQGAELSNLSDQELMLFGILTVLLIVVVLLLVVAFYAIRVVNMVMDENTARMRVEQGLPPLEKAPTWWSVFMHKMTLQVPLEKEEEVMLDHDYDGIRELDNHLPPWWKYLFYATIVFSIIYVFVYHVSGTLPLQAEEYELEMQAAAMKLEARKVDAVDGIDEFNVTFTNDADALTKGAALYKMHCVVCHGAEGQGGIGPNLTDGYWIHGGSIGDIFKVIKYGVTEKGMIPWQTTLNPTQMRDISSFIISLEGTNPPNPKAAEGQFYDRSSEVVEEETEEATEEVEETSSEESEL
jgi:cytochrome c oxidase cbb3-type subunit III